MRRLLLSFALLAASCAHGATTGKPNIIFIVADDMGNGDTGFQGCRDIPTPNLDAAECVHPMNRGFTDAYGFLGGGHQYFADTLTKPAVEYGTPLQRDREPVAETGYLTDIFGREAVSFVERHAAEPFFLYLAF